MRDGETETDACAVREAVIDMVLLTVLRAVSLSSLLVRDLDFEWSMDSVSDVENESGAVGVGVALDDSE